MAAIDVGTCSMTCSNRCPARFISRQFFKKAGYAPLTPDWPDDPATVEAARANPDVLAKKTLRQIADHTTEVINALDTKPAVMGHSTGGLLAQISRAGASRR